MQKQRAYIFLILVLLVGAIAILLTIPPQQGLDLIGGSQLTIQVKPTEEITEITSEDLAAVKRVIENRVNEFGVSETTVQTVGSDKIVVQLPGESEPETAERRLQGTAKLEFRQQRQGTEGDLAAEQQNNRLLRLQLDALTQSGTAVNPEEITQLKESLTGSNIAILSFFDPIGLNGANLEDARAQPNQTGNLWEVAINFDEEGGNKFAELTKNLAGTGRSLGIFLDDELIVEIVENRTVGATLGQDSINRSKIAGLAGLFLVLVFMGVYYRLPGLIADVSLVIYTILTLACYAIFGVTLTLPGIAGFILSIGMAVDANVLIFERTREELRSGKTLYRSVESGFYRAFSSILDSNVTTLIACGALFFLGSGLVKGFALTLAIGVLVSMFTAVSCSRTLMLLTVLSLPKVRQKPELFCPNLNQ